MSSSKSTPRHSTASLGDVDPSWAWAPYRPDDRRPWNLSRAAHLYRRAAFGASWIQLQQALAAGPEQTVDNLLKPVADMTAFNSMHDEYAAATGDSGDTNTLRAWWLRRMIQTPQPLLEKMTLFWHAHFATSNVVVKSARLMHEQVQKLRRHALGSFKPMLAEIALDPAFLLWLDAAAQRRARPCEHYARNLLEVFTLGPGVASRQDYREVARAFTGWFVYRKKLRFIDREHDTGVKTILGKEGAFGSKEVIEIILAQTAVSRFLVKKLYRWLISEIDPPGDELIAPLAASFTRDDDVAKLVRTMLCSNLFYSAHAYRRRVKSPIDFALGIIIGLEGMVGTAKLGSDLATLGQDLYQPPTVKGWSGGHDWINEATLLGRANLARAMLAGVDPYGDRLDPLALAGKHGHSTAGKAGRFLIDLMLQGDLSKSVRKKLTGALDVGGGDQAAKTREFAHCLVTLPEFQLS